jgi:uncharacterized protein (TIGR03546 family)
MLSILLRPVRLLARALLVDDSPRQLALGFTLGMVIGLIPKGNLTALALAVVLFSTQVNIGSGLAAAAVFSWVGLGLDAFAHKLGWTVLSFEPLQGVYAWFYDLPLIAWTGLNNTVVVGHLLIGMYLAFPVYCAATRVFARVHPWAMVRIRKYRITRFLFGLDVGTRWRLSK